MNSAARPVSMDRITPTVVRIAALASLVALLPSGALMLSRHRQVVYRDGLSYLDVAESLAAGRGFQEPHAYWANGNETVQAPDAIKANWPTIMRPPLWPLILSLPLALWRGANPALIAGLTGLLMHYVTAFGVGLIAWTLSGCRNRTIAAAVLAGLWPEAQPFIIGGISEPASAAVLVLGIVVISFAPAYLFAGALILSLLPLVRPVFTMFPIWIAAILIVDRLWRRRIDVAALGGGARLIAAGILFYLPITAWMIRNYRITGDFPVIAGNDGNTLWGSYNPRVAVLGKDFAYWIHPDGIPGEEPVQQLAKRMSEWEISRYYYAQGMRFIKSHPGATLALMTGHLVRTFLPVGWVPPEVHGKYRYVQWLASLALYIAALVCLRVGRLPPPRRGSTRMNSWFSLILGGVAILSATTAPVFFGGGDRYIYQLTILLIPFVCAGLGAKGAQDRSHLVTAHEAVA
jgi:hypothetical protein